MSDFFKAYGPISSYECEPLRNPRRSAGEAREKRLGLIRAFAREEEVNGIVLYSVDCADDSDQSSHEIDGARSQNWTSIPDRGDLNRRRRRLF
jgi:hypothetical protein